MKPVKNIFQLPNSGASTELVENLLEQGGLTIERIVSTGQITPPGEWYDQDRNEWLIVLQGDSEN